MKVFISDYQEGTHPKILQKLIDTNMEQTHGYGTDAHCDNAKALIKKAFDDSLTLGSDKEAENLATDFLEVNTADIVKTLNSLLSSYVSIRDSATKSKPENFYHGFMSGIVTVNFSAHCKVKNHFLEFYQAQ